jgi:hypothetical protein
MEYVPPASIRQVCDPRWRRFLIRDGGGHFWTGRGWSHAEADAMLFIRESDALRVRIHDGDTETFRAKVVVSVEKGAWTVEELIAYLSRWGRFILLKNQEARAVRVTIHWAGLEEADGIDCG